MVVFIGITKKRDAEVDTVGVGSLKSVWKQYSRVILRSYINWEGCFTKAREINKMLKIEGGATSFWWLGAFGGGCKEGVWVFWRVEVTKSWYQLSVVMVFCEGWGFE